MAAIPIWKDTRVKVGTGDYADFSILQGGGEIYTGRAYPRPGETDIYVGVNDICADYLRHAVPDFSGGVTALGYEVPFNVQGDGVLVLLSFLNDWSYEDGFDPALHGLSFPIDGRVSSRQVLLYTENGSGDLSALVNYGTLYPDFNNDFNNDFSITIRQEEDEVTIPGGVSGYRVFAIPVSSTFPQAKRITIGGHTWEVTDCGEYALHYVNAYGGWDSLLVSGNGKATDALKLYTTRTPGRAGASTPEERRTRGIYVNEMTRRYSLHTDVLTEAQSLRMHHLLESPLVFLEVLGTGAVLPVVIAGNTCEYKTYRNNGNKLMEYTIEVELAETRIRR